MRKGRGHALVHAEGGLLEGGPVAALPEADEQAQSPAAHRTGNSWPSSHLSDTSSRVSGTNTCAQQGHNGAPGRCSFSTKDSGVQAGRAAWLQPWERQARQLPCACRSPSNPASEVELTPPGPTPRPWPGIRCWSGGGGGSASRSSRGRAGTSAAPGPRRHSRPDTC